MKVIDLRAAGLSDQPETWVDPETGVDLTTEPEPAGERTLPDGRPRCQLFRFGEQCLGVATEEHEHHNPASVPLP